MTDATPAPAPDNAQARLWNGPAGHAWVESQPLLDQMLQPFEQLLLDATAPHFQGRVLDVGCGTGSTTLALSRRIGAGGRCTGVDISAPMIALARARAEREGIAADFICADAQSHAWAPASVELIVSRFGVMFFNDPVQAFANLHHAASPTAKLRFIAWRSAAENPFMTTAERAAAPLLPDLPKRQLGGPGQFAFADPQHVSDLLKASGWSGIALRPIDVTCTFPASALPHYLTRLGPVGVALEQVDEATRKNVVDTILSAFEGFVQGDEVRVDAACWWVEARA